MISRHDSYTPNISHIVCVWGGDEMRVSLCLCKVPWALMRWGTINNLWLYYSLKVCSVLYLS